MILTMRGVRRLAVAPIGVVIALLAAGCGSGVDSASEEATTTAAATATTLASGINGCVVNSWTTTEITLTITDPDTGDAVDMTGGAGEILVLGADGTYSDDVTNTEPLTGEAGGSQYELTGEGIDVGTYTTSENTLTTTSRDPTASTASVTRDGEVIATSNSPAVDTKNFECEEATSLDITTSGGIVVTYEAT